MPIKEIKIPFEGKITNKCKICHSHDISFAFEKNGYSLFTCKNCGHLFLNPIPEKEYLDKIYNSEFGVQKYILFQRFIVSNKNGEKVEIPESIIKNKKNMLKMIENNLGGKGKILDIGCGMGIFLSIAKQEGWEVYGVDTDQKAIEFAKNMFGIESIYNASIEDDFYLEKDFFDAVLMSHILEHLPEPFPVIEKIYKVLRIKGILFIQIPYKDSLIAKQTGQKWEYYDFPIHTDLYSIRSIVLLLESNGFFIKNIIAKNNMLNVIAMKI